MITLEGMMTAQSIPESRTKERVVLGVYFLPLLLSCPWKYKHSVGILGKVSLKMDLVTINQLLFVGSTPELGCVYFAKFIW